MESFRGLVEDNHNKILENGDKCFSCENDI